MSNYTVQSGQNIYDVSLTLYGSIEGIFDLLVSNPGISLDTVLTKGMKLEYHQSFIINKSIPEWFEKHNIKVKNNHYEIHETDIYECIIKFIEKQNERLSVAQAAPIVRPMPRRIPTSGGIAGITIPDNWQIPNRGDSTHPIVQDQLVATIGSIVAPTDKQELEQFYNDAATPKILIKQKGSVCIIDLQLQGGRFIMLDWGDDTEPEGIAASTSIKHVVHNYKDFGEHTITVYGVPNFINLDFTHLNGIYYALAEIPVSKKFTTPFRNSPLNKLFILNE